MSGYKIKWILIRKKNLAKNDFEEDFSKKFNNALYGKTTEFVRNRVKIEIFKKDEIEKIVKQQSRLNFKGIH